MTCEYSNINQHDALYNLVRAYPGGLEAIAQRVGMNTMTLRKKVMPSVETHHANFEEVSVIIELAEGARVPDAFVPLHAFCWRHGHVAVKLPCGDPDADDLLKQLVEVMGDEGQLANTIGGSLANDKRIDRREFEEIEINIEKCLHALVVLRQKVLAKHKADTDPA